MELLALGYDPAIHPSSMATNLMDNRPLRIRWPARTRPEWRPHVDGPHFVVIGAQKAGSSFVQDALRAHPEIYMPRGESSLLHDSRAAEARDQLERIAHRGRTRQVVGIKRPDYLADSDAATRMSELLPYAKLVAIIRNPVDRALSAYYHYMLHGLIPVREPDEGFEYLLANHSYSDYPRSSEILEYGFYAKHLSTYLSLFPASQMHIIVYDALRSAPAKVLQELFTFLQVGEDARVRVRQSNPTVYSLDRIRLIRALAAPFGQRPGADVGRPWHIPGMLRALQTTDAAAGKVFRLTGNRPNLSQGLQQRLRGIYRPDILRLQTDLGLEVSGWQ